MTPEELTEEIHILARERMPNAEIMPGLSILTPRFYCDYRDFIENFQSRRRKTGESFEETQYSDSYRYQ